MAGNLQQRYRTITAASVNIKHLYKILIYTTKTFYEQQDTGEVRLRTELRFNIQFYNYLYHQYHNSS